MRNYCARSRMAPGSALTQMLSSAAIGCGRITPEPRGGGPPAVGFRALDLGQAGRPHPSRRDQLLDLGHVDLRPAAAWPARHVLLQVVDLVVGLALAGDPAVAEAKVDRLVIGQRRDARSLLRDLQPHTDPLVD